ncbi:hypothetical protein [Arthrobacter sp. 31Y]|uniref:hypothetical protein n=1 Tax=Arthrobacter sp. 31Y TaxID=1115632 RepID=UPI00046752D0|nr:hypothetical protein [Arthrobacter sp. 31Y]
MIDGIPAVVGLASPVAATIAVFYLVFRGTLWTRTAHMDVVRVLEAQVVALTTDRNNWHSAATLANQTNSELAKANSEFIENAKFSTHVMSALQNVAGGAPHVVQETTR